MEDVKKWMEAQTEEAAQLNKAQAAVRQTRSGNMRGVIETLTGEGVAEGDEQTEKEIPQTGLEEPAPGDTGVCRRNDKGQKDAVRQWSDQNHCEYGDENTSEGSKMGAASGGTGWWNSHIETIAGS